MRGGIPAGTTRVMRSGRGGALVLRKFRLRVTGGPDKGESVVVEADRAGIGSAPGNVLRLSDNTASRHHAEIVNTDDGFLLRDVGSTNGTQVDGRRVLAVYLDKACKLRVGDSVIKFDPLDETVEEPLSDRDRLGEMVGQSPAMRRMFSQLSRLAGMDMSVLLIGESGTGKELCARALHAEGPRRDGPFVVVDCGALPENLIESELFGHTAGAFTGASSHRIGAFERADGGTLFLDEIGELPLALQPKLLGALERREVQPLGATGTVRFDTRVVAATNRDLRVEVNQKRFRADLYYRLSVVVLDVPPLRERLEDLPLLVDAILESTAERMGGELEFRLSGSTLERLKAHPWPGNVRELRNFIERAIALADDDPVPGADAVVLSDEGGGATVRTELPYRTAKALWVEHFEKAFVSAIVERTGGNVSAASRTAKMDRAHLIDLMKKHGLKG